MGSAAEDPGQPDVPRPLLGIALKLSSVFAFVCMGALIKLTGDLPAGQIVFNRSAFAVIPILIFLAWRKQLATAFRTSRPLSHLGRGTVGSVAMFLSFVSLTNLPLPESTTLNYVQPLLVVVFSAIFLREVVRAYRWSAVAIGFVGVAIIVWPKLTVFTGGAPMSDREFVGVSAALGAAAVSACAALLTRRLVLTERSATIVMWFSLTASAFALLTWPFGWASLSSQQMALLVACGICGGLGQIFMTEAYRHAEVSTVAPFEYTSIIFATIFGYTLFAEVPTLNMLVGGVVVISAGIFIIWREHRLGLPRAAARKVTPPS